MDDRSKKTGETITPLSKKFKKGNRLDEDKENEDEDEDADESANALSRIN